jgi:hypothetical protein
MPNLNEFFDKKEILIPDSLEKINGVKPCSKCELDVSESWFDPEQQMMFWTCANNHKTEYVIN